MLTDVSIAHARRYLLCLYHAPPHAGFLFLKFAPLQNELCKVAPWEGIGMAHLIKELLEINAALLGASVDVWRRLHALYMCL